MLSTFWLIMGQMCSTQTWMGIRRCIWVFIMVICICHIFPSACNPVTDEIFVWKAIWLKCEAEVKITCLALQTNSLAVDQFWLNFVFFADNKWATESLIKSGANINAQNIYGDSPLHLAVSRGMFKLDPVLRVPLWNFFNFLNGWISEKNVQEWMRRHSPFIFELFKSAFSQG